MILDEKLEIKVNPSNINHYKIFYSNISVGDLILVDVEQLTKGSKYEIKMRCDKCYNELYIPYNFLYKTDSLHNFICKKCKRKNTNQKKYGVDNVFQLENIKNKSKETIKNQYGVDNVSQSDKIKKKKINTFLKKYGVEWGLSSDIIKEKSKKTINKKYNVDNISKLDNIKRKKEETCFKNHGVDYISQHENFKKNLDKLILKKLQIKYKNLLDISGDNFTFFCEKCGKEFEIYKKSFYTRHNLNIGICTFCNPIGSVHSSGSETILYEFISNNIDKVCIRNVKNIIHPYELDIYIPELKLSFEFNGLFWHNENNVHKNYHLYKTEKCEKLGIQLVHIWEDEWLFKQEIIKSMILNKLNKTPNKIYARKCEIKEVLDNNLIRDFLNQNHIQGFIGTKVKLGLFYENKLVSLMTFGNRRVAMGKKSTEEYELLRFCNKLNTNVIGGASKLFKYFINNYNPKKITTCVDRSFSQGKLYEILGFRLQSKTQPNYYYIKNKIRQHRFNFRKDILVKEGYDSTKTEHEIMLERKISRIYDSGNLKFIFNT